MKFNKGDFCRGISSREIYQVVDVRRRKVKVRLLNYVGWVKKSQLEKLEPPFDKNGKTFRVGDQVLVKNNFEKVASISKYLDDRYWVETESGNTFVWSLNSFFGTYYKKWEKLHDVVRVCGNFLGHDTTTNTWVFSAEGFSFTREVRVPGVAIEITEENQRDLIRDFGSMFERAFCIGDYISCSEAGYEYLSKEDVEERKCPR